MKEMRSEFHLRYENAVLRAKSLVVKSCWATTVDGDDDVSRTEIFNRVRSGEVFVMELDRANSSRTKLLPELSLSFRPSDP